MLNKRIKSSILTALILVSTSGSVSIVNADSKSNEVVLNADTFNQESIKEINNINEDDLRAEASSLLEKYGYEVQNEELSKKSKPDIEFDTIEEFEEFLKKSENEYEENKETVQKVNLDEVNPIIDGASTRATYSHHFKQDSEQWTMFYKRNMTMKYETKTVNGFRQFVRVYDRNAYPTGFTVGTWKVHSGGYTQTYSKKHHDRDTVTNKINGQWKATASVAGIPIGYTKDQTWTFTLWIA